MGANLKDISFVIGRKADGGLECMKLSEDAGQALDLFRDLRANGGGGYSHLQVYRRGGLIKRASFDAPAANIAPKAHTHGHAHKRKGE